MLYPLAVSVAVGTPSAVQLSANLNGTLQQPATANWTSQQLSTAWPWLDRGGYTNYYGVAQGYLYGWAYQRGAGKAWTTTDLSNLTSTGPTLIPGWPSAPSGPPKSQFFFGALAGLGAIIGRRNKIRRDGDIKVERSWRQHKLSRLLLPEYKRAA